ncbi:hypothetical protein AB0M29_11190 [Streptomyces sp. NPDC051976]|uniref:hypothetical protein n=1 Tax=Streptomyces sp. NPDC051976 TaxID=3154947 RepID=UPI00343DF6D3
MAIPFGWLRHLSGHQWVELIMCVAGGAVLLLGIVGGIALWLDDRRQWAHRHDND